YRPMWLMTQYVRGKLRSFISISMEDICGIYTEVYYEITFYLKGSPSNLSKVQAVLNLFSFAFGAKVNW
ncbi:unnamed protein product, partial [Sphagnum balticum]